MTSADALLEQDAQRARQLAERQLAQLARLNEIAMALAETAIACDIAEIGRCLRYTHALEARISSDLSRLVERIAEGVYEREDLRERSTPEYRQKAKVEALIERIAEARGDRKREVTRLVREAAERLDEEHFDLDRPVEQIVAEICRALGLDGSKFLPPPTGLAGGGVSNHGERFGHDANAEEPVVEGARMRRDASNSFLASFEFTDST